MNFINFPLVITSENEYEAHYMKDSFLYIQIIKRRIEKETERYFRYKEINPRKSGHAGIKIALDIKTIFIFFKIYLDYLARYISNTFFKEVYNLESNTYHKHINSLNKVNTNSQLFKNYKEYILKSGSKLVYRVGLLRDKLLEHRLLNKREHILIDSTRKKIGLAIEPISKKPKLDELNKPIIDGLLKEEILLLAKKNNILLEQKITNLQDFEYFDLILKKIEETGEVPIRSEIGVLRQRLGVILDADEAFLQIFEFTMGLKNIFKCNDIILIDLPDEL